jgi:hypothetical protein
MLKALFGGKSKEMQLESYKSNESSTTREMKSFEVKEKQVTSTDKSIKKFPFPTLESGMTDHIIQHRRGEEFDYVNITHPIKEEKKSIISRLQASFPKIGKESVNINETPPLFLRDATEVFTLADCFPSVGGKGKNKNEKRSLKAFLLLDELIINFVPTTSFTDNFTDVSIRLHDERKVQDTIVRSSTANSNITKALIMSLDYCIPSESVQKIKLSFCTENNLLDEGEIWAAVKVTMKISHLDFPIQTSLLDTIGTYKFPATAMIKYDKDPKHFNSTLDGEDLAALQIMRSQGDIRDFSSPREKTDKKITLAGTAYGGAKVGSDNSSIINDIDNPDNIPVSPPSSISDFGNSKIPKLSRAIEDDIERLHRQDGIETMIERAHKFSGNPDPQTSEFTSKILRKIDQDYLADKRKGKRSILKSSQGIDASFPGTSSNTNSSMSRKERRAKKRNELRYHEEKRYNAIAESVDSDNDILPPSSLVKKVGFVGGEYNYSI